MTQITTSLSLTVLPNGFENKDTLRLSVYLSPSISTDDHSKSQVKGTPFDGWPSKVRQKAQQAPPSTQQALAWSLRFTTATGGATVVSPSSSPLAGSEWNPDLWTAIFGGNRQTGNRKGNADLQNSWRLSHNISDLHDRHRNLRYTHALRALNAKMAKTAPDSSLSQLQALHAGYQTEIDCLTPPVLYLYPTLQGDNTDASLLVDQRKQAVAARNQIDSAVPISPDLKSKIQARIDHALDILEKQEGARLQAPALYCLYRHCLASVLPPGSSISSSPLNTLYNSFTAAAAQVMPPACANSPDPVAAYQNYVEMLLFHRRKPDQKECTIDTPDFHQLLGMVNHYPAMLRPLALVFDLKIQISTSFSDGVYLVEVASPSPFTDHNIFPNLNVVSYRTQCQVHRADQTFCADAADPSILDHGYLALNATADDSGSAYNFYQEDADGSSLKFTDQANNAARASEYSSSAPTSMSTLPASTAFDSGSVSPTPAFSAHPTTATPAARTVGVALFHQDRLGKLENIIQKTPSVTASGGAPADPGPLHAEDLMLGIRVDIQHGTRPWRSLCARQSKYQIGFIDSPDKNLEWQPDPNRAIEVAADEGFVTFAATHSSLDDDTTQTQIHQALFTWTGWSLAVPKPKGFQSVNPPPKNGDDCQSQVPLKISPNFTLPPATLLPALRFNDAYKVRCRVVDLAGNSLPCSDSDTVHSASLNPVFSRHEPIRAPQILLTEPIDRAKSPGENIDHLIARDGEEVASRMLVPPRESLRLAELHGVITKKNPLPESAFTSQNLMPDGSFPSVQDAYERGWISDEIDPSDCTHNQDAIFTKRGDAFEAINPFYPDPLAHYIRVKPFLVSDDPTRSRPLGEPFYIVIDPLDNWPNFLATVVDLNAHPDEETPTVDFDNDERPPSITVNLPRGYTVVLQISSAAHGVPAKPRRTDGSKSVALHQFYKTRTHALANMPSQRRLAYDVIGHDVASVQARHDMLSSLVVDRNSQKTGNDVLDDPNSYVDGDLPQMTPARTLTFVHATRRPLAAPDFGPKGSAGDLRVIRARGECKAALYAGVSAHWLSTSKVTCHAEWQDLVDDIKAAAPGRASKPTKDVAFAITASDTENAPPDFNGSVYLRMLKSGIAHAFTDTRAHDVTYTLSAATRFRGYFPGPAPVPPRNPPAPPPDESAYSLPKPDEHNLSVRKLTVLSSVRPPALKIAYIVPAFCWRDTYDKKSRTWFSGRDVLLRAYFERPFYVSGDLEGVGVVFAAPGLSDEDKTQPFISRWGSDPVRPITQPILSSALTDKNLCRIDEPAEACLLAEGGIAMTKPFAVQFARDRKLWFADIPINTMGAFAPFVRLALVRWQPQALCGPLDPVPAMPVDPNYDARISPVVFADFIQISPNRWVSVQRRSDSEYVVTVSGVFPPPENEANPAITLALYSRWYATGQDTGWRLVDSETRFTYIPASTNSDEPHSAISSWIGTLKLKHSASNRKYRVLLRENEWYSNAKEPRVTYSQFVDLP